MLSIFSNGAATSSQLMDFRRRNPARACSVPASGELPGHPAVLPSDLPVPTAVLAKSLICPSVCLFIQTLFIPFSQQSPADKTGTQLQSLEASQGMATFCQPPPATQPNQPGRMPPPPPAARRCMSFHKSLTAASEAPFPHQAALNGRRLFFLLKFPSGWGVWLTRCLGTALFQTRSPLTCSISLGSPKSCHGSQLQ